jgi:hypothetical protein
VRLCSRHTPSLCLCRSKCSVLCVSTRTEEIAIVAPQSLKTMSFYFFSSRLTATWGQEQTHIHLCPFWTKLVLCCQFVCLYFQGLESLARAWSSAMPTFHSLRSLKCSIWPLLMTIPLRDTPGAQHTWIRSCPFSPDSVDTRYKGPVSASPHPTVLMESVKEVMVKRSLWDTKEKGTKSYDC